MTTPESITILNQQVRFGRDSRHIDELRFLPENPRVYAVTHGRADFSDLPSDEQQRRIFDALRREPSVERLKREIKHNGGLMEPILVRHDRRQVVEGNSRLAAYRLLRAEDPGGDWETIPCNIVAELTDQQQAAYLQQIHVAGKTEWSAYEKAYFAYFYYARKTWSVDSIAELFDETVPTIRRKIEVIEMMAQNSDPERSHYSHYDVLYGVRQRAPKDRQSSNDPIWKKVLTQIREIGIDDERSFTAQELRARLPVVMRKPKVEKRFLAGKINLEEAWQRAKISRVEERLRKAIAMLRDVEPSEIRRLEADRVKALALLVRRATREVKRLNDALAATRTAK